MDLTLRPIGYVRSTIPDVQSAPRFETADAPPADLVIDPDIVPAMKDLAVGDDIFVFTWLHLADRTCLQAHPRGKPEIPMRGVFTIRSPARPNPIGLHRARITAIDGPVITVGAMEAINGTPLLDIKPAEGGKFQEGQPPCRK